MRYWLAFIIFWLVTTAQSQSITPSLISSSGSQVDNGQIQLQWSVGEVVIGQSVEQNFQLNAGFHQNLAESSSTSVFTEDPAFFYKAYPNPIHLYFQLEVNHPGKIDYQLNDILGQTINNGSFQAGTRIQAMNWPKGIYFLEMRQNQQIICTIKIMK